jgi:hypothetical protein
VTWYAHPMGWRKAIIGGVLYGTAVSGFVYIVWRAVTLSGPLHQFWPIFLWLWVMCFVVVIASEKDERDKIKKGAVDIRTGLQRHPTRR